MFDQATLSAISNIAARYGWSPAALAAIAEVESGGGAFSLIDGRPEPLIRWEGHYFDRRLTGKTREQARAAGLAHPTAGAIPNPASQAKRWALLARAVEINAEAAYESCSYGVGQVMGAHWSSLKFDSVTDLVNLCRRDVAGQVELMARFVDKNGLADELRRLDWTAFARGYNGPNYRVNAYDTKMAKAYGRWLAKLGDGNLTLVKRPTLRRGDKGEAVLALQQLLNARGRSLMADGDFGPRTENSVRVFQETAGLAVDGIVGPKTWAALGG
jgi:hypothetical protein